MWNRLKRLFGWAREAEALHGLATWDPLRHYLYPALGPVIMAVFGLAGSVPLMWILFASLGSVAFITTALLRYDEWQTRVDPIGKLVIAHPGLRMVGTKIAKNGNGSQEVERPFLVGATPSVYLINNAPYPIEFYVTHITSIVMGRINIRPTYLNRGFIIQPGQHAWFDDDFIEIDQFFSSDPIVATIEISLNYWRKPSAKRNHNLKIRLVASVDRDSGEVIDERWHFDSDSKNLVTADMRDS